jgi:hypothetical protein
MQLRVIFKNNAAVANFGTIAIRFLDEEGLVPASGSFSAYVGVTDPLGYVINPPGALVGTYGASGQIEIFLDIPVDADNRFVSGIYNFVFQIKDGEDIILTKTQNYTYLANVFAVTDTDKNNEVQVPKVITSCETLSNTASLVLDNTGYTVASTGLIVLPEHTLGAPYPVPISYVSLPQTVAFVKGLSYKMTFTTIRSKTLTDEEVALSTFIVEENLQNILTVIDGCDQWCALSTCLGVSLAEGVCVSTIESLEKRVAFLEKAVYLLLLDKCGDPATMETYYKSMLPLSCGCGCS